MFLLSWLWSGFRIWDPVRFLFAVEMALITTDLVLDDDIHQGAPQRTVSPETAQLLTGGWVVPAVLVCVVLWMLAPESSLVRQVVIPVLGLAAGAAKVWLTSGEAGLSGLIGFGVLYLLVLHWAPLLVRGLFLFAGPGGPLRLVIGWLALLLLALGVLGTVGTLMSVPR